MSKSAQKYTNQVSEMLRRLADVTDETAVPDSVALSQKIRHSRLPLALKDDLGLDLHYARENRKDLYEKPKLTVIQGGNDFLARKSRAQLTLVKAA